MLNRRRLKLAAPPTPFFVVLESQGYEGVPLRTRTWLTGEYGRLVNGGLFNGDGSAWAEPYVQEKAERMADQRRDRRIAVWADGVSQMAQR